MLNIEKNINAAELNIALSGRLDTTTAPELEKELKASMDDVTSLVIDMKALEYISSAGLRVVLGARKAMGESGSFAVKNLCSDVREIFDITGFSDIITIE